MRKKIGAIAALIGLSLVLATVALAAVDDTLLIEGFDPENNTFVFGVSPIRDGAIDCSVEGVDYDYTTSGTFVTSLSKGGSPVTFRLGQVDVPYGQTSGACDLSTVNVTGPAGQVNHGQVVSSFVHTLKARLDEAGINGGIGCLVRIVAQADYGKGVEQQSPTSGGEAVILSGQIDLEAHEATCHRGRGEVGAEGQIQGDGNGGNGNGNSNANRENGNGGNGNGGNGNGGNGNGGNGNGNH